MGIVTLQWRTNTNNMSDVEANFIRAKVKFLAKPKGSACANVRMGVHDTTNFKTPNSGTTSQVRDPDGRHFTFEIDEPKKGIWWTYHYYVIVKGDEITRRDNLDRNPKIYPNDKSKAKEKRANDPEDEELIY